MNAGTRFLRCLFILFVLLNPWIPTEGLGQINLSNSKPEVAVAKPVLDVEGVSDSALEDRLRAVFAQIGDFKDVRLSVKDGVVRLSGKVLRSETRKRAEQLVSRFQGVVYVEDAIEEETDVEGRLNPAIAKLNEYIKQSIKKLPVIGVAILVTLLFWVVSVLLLRWEAPYRRLAANPLLRSLVRRVLRTIILLFGVLIALDILDITAVAGALVGAAGVVGLAVSFAFRDIVENYLSGVLLSVRSPFTLNDLVRIDNYEGRILRLTAREMVMMTLEGDHVRIPNTTVFKSTIYNYTHNPLRRFDFAVGVGTSESLANVERVGCHTLDAMNGVMDEPGPFMRVEELGDFNVVVRFFGWVDQRAADFLKVKSEAIRLVKAALDEAGIEMPVPHQTVRVVREIARDAAGEAKPKPRAAVSVDEEARKANVSVDTQLDRQIEEDLATSKEENLLKKSGS